MKYYFLTEMMLNHSDGNPNRQGVILSHSGKGNGQVLRSRFVAQKEGKGRGSYSWGVLWRTKKKRIIKNRTIIINAVHSKKLSAFRFFHNEMINSSDTVKTSL
jgi:uracil DNA glycosylase